MITVKQIIDELKKYFLVLDCSADENKLGRTIESISYNSKDIGKNTLFICKGMGFKAEYLAQAVQNGAVAYVAESKFDEIPEDIAFIKVSDVRRAMSIISILFYDYPYKDCPLYTSDAVDEYEGG
ncbi:MAG TPA: hypothetical protein DCP97_05235, partial [Ruminococcaceae bacterium]|nr:hypothetical protein [Oscillospiraceae bacterium]